MAGTLTISTLSDGTNSTSATNCIQGSAKAWVNYSGTTQTIRASYNVSSITRVATGEYAVNFTNAFADTNYTVAMGGITSTGGGGRFTNGPINAAPTTSAFRIYCSQSGVGAVDYDYFYAQFWR